MHGNTLVKLILLVVCMLVAAALSLLYGGSESLGSGGEASEYILQQIRFPKTITAIVAGSALALAGLVLQIIFRNPLAGPYVLGISSGASVMVALCLLAGASLPFFSGRGIVVAAAVTGSLAITILILAISRRVSSNVILLLIGLMIAQICGAIELALEYFADPGRLKTFVLWGMGSLSATNNSDLYVFVPLVTLSALALLFYIKPLNALLLGENYARSAGINYGGSRFGLILFSSLLTGVTTAFCGPLAFVGIAVPILSRMIFKTSRQQVHLVSCMLIGSTLLLFADFASHALIRNTALPVNMITTLIGAPLVVYLMFKNKYW